MSLRMETNEQAIEALDLKLIDSMTYGNIEPISNPANYTA